MKIWLGKLTGAAFGLFSGGPFGIVIGLIAGHLLDQFIERSIQGVESPNSRSGNASGPLKLQIQQIFFRTTFRVMGRIAKADGRVLPEEIAAAQSIMSQMGLNDQMRQQAIQFFTEGKATNFDLSEDIQQLKAALRHQPSLAQIFLEIQLGIAYSDGTLAPEESQVFQYLGRELGISGFQFEWIHARVKAAAAGGRYSDSQYSNSGGAGRPPSDLSTAYAVLGVKSDISDKDLKKAYRKLMSQHHPDKLVAKGLPAEMMKLAKEKTQEIQSAYDQIAQARKGSTK
jgi:DnaJ like chaperone protein